MVTKSPSPLTILRRRQVEARVGLRRSQIYELMRRRAFPLAVRLGSRSVGWLEHEIEAWLTARVVASREGR